MRADIKDSENTGMIQRAGRARLLFKSPQTIKITAQGTGQDLDRNFAAQPGSRARYTSPIPPAPRGETI